MPARPDAAGYLRLFWIASAILTALSVTARGEASVSYRSYFTNEQHAGIPASAAKELFDCTEQIFAVIEIDGLSRDEHVLEIGWKDPKGALRETNRLRFPAMSARERLWAWLKLHHDSESILATVFDRASGMREFIGEWTVEFRLDGRRVDSGRFQVIC